MFNGVCVCVLMMDFSFAFRLIERKNKRQKRQEKETQFNGWNAAAAYLYEHFQRKNKREYIIGCR